MENNNGFPLYFLKIKLFQNVYIDDMLEGCQTINQKEYYFKDNFCIGEKGSGECCICMKNQIILRNANIIYVLLVFQI